VVEKSASGVVDYIPDVSGISVYKHGTVRVLRGRSGVGSTGGGGGGQRGNIYKMTRKSVNRLMFVLRETDMALESMMVLTFGSVYPTSGKLAKASVNRWLSWLRYRRPDLRYIWVMEFQRRGAPHFHVLLNHRVVENQRELYSGRWASAALSGLVSRESEDYQKLWMDIFRVHKFRKQWQNSRERDGIVRYMSSYLAKSYQKEIPRDYGDVGRWWSSAKGVADIEPVETYEIKEEAVRDYLLAVNSPLASWDFLPKYIWQRNVSRETS
jgi:hypothetical protein